MPLLALSTAFAQRVGVLCCCVLFITMGAQALAQTSATDNPSPAAQTPSEPVAEKPAVEEQLVAPGEKPATAESKPAVAQEKPAAVDEKSASPEETSAVVGQKPVQADDKPAVAEDKPASSPEKPAAEDKPAVVEQKPVRTEESPAVTEDKPAVVPETPAAAEAKPAVVEQKPVAASDKPELDKSTQDKSAHPRKERPAEAGAAEEKHEAMLKHGEHGKPANTAKTAISVRKRMARGTRERTMVMSCRHFRTYDASLGTYRGYDRQIHSCR